MGRAIGNPLHSQSHCPAPPIAARPVAHGEFEVIRARCDRADNDLERAIAVDVGRDNAHFDANDGLSNALPCHRETVPAAGTVGRKLSESGGERGAVNVSADLVEFVGRSPREGKGDRQFARR
jgi:hypothetical protein